MFDRNFFVRLRQLPENSRRRILIGSTFSITAFIFIIWASVRFYNINEPITEKVVSKSYAETPIKEVTGAIGQFADSLGEGFRRVKGIFSDTEATTSLPDFSSKDLK